MRHALFPVLTAVLFAGIIGFVFFPVLIFGVLCLAGFLLFLAALSLFRRIPRSGAEKQPSPERDIPASRAVIDVAAKVVAENDIPQENQPSVDQMHGRSR